MLSLLASVRSMLSSLSTDAIKRWKEELALRQAFLMLMHGVLLLAHLPSIVWIIALAKFLPLGESVQNILSTINENYGQKYPGYWGPIPDDFALLLYAFTLVFLVVGGYLLAKYSLPFLRHEHRTYIFLLSLVIPLVAVLYTFTIFEEIRKPATFILSVLPFLTVITRGSQFGEYVYVALTAAIAFSILLILLLAGESSITLLSWSTAAGAVLAYLLLKCDTQVHVRAIMRFLCVSTVAWAIFATQMEINNTYTHIHYGYFLGPILDILYAAKNPLQNVNAQYGPGLTMVLAQVFHVIGFVSPDAFLFLLKIFTFLQYLLICFICRSLFSSRTLAYLTLLCILTLVYFSHGASFFSNPSLGFFRFGAIFPILAVFTAERDGYIKKSITYVTTCVLTGFFATLSIENAIFLLGAIPLGVLLARGSKESLRYCVGSIFCTCVFLVILFGNVLVHEGLSPLLRYLEYARIYSTFFSVHGLYHRQILWVLPILLGAWFLLRGIFQRESDERIFMLAAYGLLSYSYFIIRALETNFAFASIPFIILAVLLATRLPRPQFYASCMVGVLLSTLANLPILTGKQGIWSGEALALLSPASPQFALRETSLRQKFCNSEWEAFRPFITNQGLPLITRSDTAYLIYACLKTGNALGLNPLTQSAINPEGARRIVEDFAPKLTVEHLLVEKDFPEILKIANIESSLVQYLLQNSAMVPKEKVTIAGASYVVLRKAL